MTISFFQQTDNKTAVFFARKHVQIALIFLFIILVNIFCVNQIYKSHNKMLIYSILNSAYRAKKAALQLFVGCSA